MLGGIGVAAIGALLVRRRTQAETADIITQAAERVVKQIESRSAALESEVTRLWSAVWALSALVRTHGGDPASIVEALQHGHDWRRK